MSPNSLKSGYYDSASDRLVVCEKAVELQMKHFVTGFVLPGSNKSRAEDLTGFKLLFDDMPILENISLEIGVDGAGVRAVAGTVKHELMHREIFFANNATNLTRPIYIEMDGEDLTEYDNRDMDGDYIDDVSEQSGRWNVRSMPKINPDTYSLASLYDDSYAIYGDEEVRARFAERDGLEVAYDPLKDWANPGCQSKRRRGPKPSETKEADVL